MCFGQWPAIFFPRASTRFSGPLFHKTLHQPLISTVDMGTEGLGSPYLRRCGDGYPHIYVDLGTGVPEIGGPQNIMTTVWMFHWTLFFFFFGGGGGGGGQTMMS